MEQPLVTNTVTVSRFEVLFLNDTLTASNSYVGILEFFVKEFVICVPTVFLRFIPATAFVDDVVVLLLVCKSYSIVCIKSNGQ